MAKRPNEVVEISNIEFSTQQQIENLKKEINDLQSQLELKKKALRELGGAKTRVNVGVKEFVTPLIKEGLTNKQILEKVHSHYGNDNTTYACVAWYRNNLKSQKVEVKVEE